MRVTILFFLLLIALNSSSQTYEVLFLGNSYTAYNNLPQLTADFALGAGDTLVVDSNTPGGYTFFGHTTNVNSQNKIAAGNWDFVVLQEQSQLPSFPLQQVEESCFPYASILNTQILDANPCAETVFYMTWGRQAGDSDNCANWPPVCTYEGMDDLLFERYMTMAETNEGVVSPVGRVWRYLRENHPEINLYASDGSHPSAAGSYAAASAFYVVFFREDPSQSDYDYTLDPNVASIIRNAAKTVVYENMLDWHLGSYDVLADFSYVVGENFEVSFTNLSENATSFSWDFGFTSSEEVNPVVLFPGSESFLIELTAANGCTESITQQIVSTQPLSISDPSSFVEVFPNPASDFLHVKFSPDWYEMSWMLCDASGRIVSRVGLSDNVTFDLQSLAAGVYSLYAVKHLDRNVFVRKVIVE